jgi:hypothetical protein
MTGGSGLPVHEQGRGAGGGAESQMGPPEGGALTAAD